MATPPETPEHDDSSLRCHMCGTENPANTLYCSKCGSALKPVTSPEQTPPPPGEDEPTLDLLAQLRAEIESDSEATVIHRPGSGKSVADLINEMEPDFVFGSSQEPGTPEDQEEPSPAASVLASSSIPDWLSDITDSDEPEADSAITDWLVDSAPAPSADQVPDWLRESLSDQPATPDSGAKEAAPEPEPTPPVESGVPDWLTESLGGAPATPTKSPVSPAAPEDDTMPDWLAEGLSDTPLQPSSPPPSADVPDWLPAAEGTPPTRGTVPDWIPENPPSQPVVGATPDWLPAAEAPSMPSMPPAPAADAGVPDWLSAAGGADDDLPDWLQDASPVPPLAGPVAPPAAEPLPTGEPAPAPTPAKAGADDLPDWLQDAAPVSSKAEPEAEAEELPDWLAGAGTDQPPAPAPTPAEAGAGDLPDWLQDSSPIPDKAEPEAEAEELPDWLSTPAAEAPPAAEPAPTGGPAPTPDLPDWLAGAGTELPPAPSEAGAPTPAPTPTEAGTADLPDWLVGTSEEAPAPVEKEEVEAPPPATPDAAGLPDWLVAAGEQEVELPGQPQPAGPDLEEEDWLELLDQDRPEAEPAAARPSAPISADDDLLGFMDSLGLGESPPPAAQEASDLLGLPGDSGPPATLDEMLAEEDEIVGDLSALPGWTQDAEGDMALPDGIEVTPELVDEIDDLRFESITGKQPQERDHDRELVGALKNVAGVIQPELIFEGGTLRVGERLDTLITSKSQARQIIMIEQMLAREASGERATEREVDLPLVRWLTTLILLVAIAIPSLTGMSIAPPAKVPQSVVTARQHISSLPPDANVLVAFEYEPDTAAEMEPLALALLNDLASKPDLTVYAVSTRPTGPAMAHKALQSTANLNGVNLGYIAGGRNGISALTIGSISGIPSPLATDYAGEPTNITGNSLLTMQPPVNLILVLTARQEYLQTWVEQAGGPTGIPIIAATSAGSAPMAYPYQQSGQLVAVINGVNEAAAYPGRPQQDITLNLLSAQVFGAVVTVIAIIAGTVVLGLRVMREQQEQVG